MPNTLDDFYDKASELEIDIKSSQQAVRRSSGLYKTAQEKNTSIKEKLSYYKDQGKELTAYEIAELRKEAEEARNAFEQYNDRYNKKKNPKPKTVRRGELSKEGVSFLDELLNYLDEKQAAIENKETKSPNQMAQEALKASDALEKSNEGVRFGSDQYKDAMKALQKYQDILAKHVDDNGELKADSFTSQELDEMNTLLTTIERNATEYANNKENKNLNKNPKIAKRLHDITDAKDMAQRHKAKVESLMEANKEKVQELDEMFKESEEATSDIQEAQKGVHNGSKEFDEAQKQFKYLNASLKETQEVSEYQFNSYQRRVFLNNIDNAEQAIDKYLLEKDKKDSLDAKTQKRVDAMKRAKNVCLEARKKLNKVRDEDRKEAAGYTNQQLDDNAKEVTESLEKGSQALRVSMFNGGSEEYKNGKKAFSEAVEYSKDVFKNDNYKKMTPEERAQAIKKLKDKRWETEKYIKKKNKEVHEGKELNDNGKIRMQSMHDAHSHLTFLIDKLEEYQERSKEKEYSKADFDKKVADRIKSIDDRQKKTTLDRTRSNASKESLKALNKFGKRKTLTASEMKAAKYAMAALIVDERISALTKDKDKAKYPSSPREYAKMVKAVAESKDFKKMFPDDKITPETLRTLATNPKECKKAMRGYYGEVGKVNNFEKKKLGPENKKSFSPQQL